MASDETLTTAFRLLLRAYPDHVKRHLSDVGAVTELQRLYAQFLDDVPDDLLIASVEAHIANDIWWPKIASLRTRAADLSAMKAGLPTAFEAWAEVQEHVLQTRPDPWSSELIGTAIKGIGGLRAYGHSQEDQHAAWRARFYQSYETLVKRERDRAILPERTKARLGIGKLRALEGATKALEAESDG